MDLHQGQLLNEDQIMKLETVFLLEKTIKAEKRHIHRERHSFRRTSNPGDINGMYQKCNQVWLLLTKIKDISKKQN